MKINTKKRIKSLRKNFITSFIKLLKIFFLIIYFLSMLAGTIPPDKFFLPSFLTIFFPFLCLIFFYLFYRITKKKKFNLYIIYLPLFFLSLYNLNFYFPYLNIFSRKNIKGTKAKEIKILSFNVRLFDRYNWMNNHKYHKPILNYITLLNADIMCFQEYYYQSDNKYPTRNFLLKMFPNIHYHEFFPMSQKETDFFGIATFSKFPIVNKYHLKFEKTSNSALITDILIENDTIRIYNLHLESVRLGEEDKIFEVEPKNIANLSFVSKIKNIYYLLKKACIKRKTQIDSIINDIKKCKYPIILCGDFNDVPSSYAYQKINKYLSNSYNKFYINLGNTFNGFFPYLRIDNIFFSYHFSLIDFKIDYEMNYSDHFPIICNLLYYKKNNIKN